MFLKTFYLAGGAVNEEIVVGFGVRLSDVIGWAAVRNEMVFAISTRAVGSWQSGEGILQ
jgi:hypothetical protein